MEKQTGNTRFMQTFVSTDCVIFGFDRNQLHVLLVERNTLSANEGHLKLPGSLIYQEEDADSAAARVLSELTGIKKMVLKQFKSFTSLQRTSNPADTLWLQQEYHNQIDRLITIAYLSICKIDRKLHTVSKYKKVVWYPFSSVRSQSNCRRSFTSNPQLGGARTFYPVRITPHKIYGFCLAPFI